jgi:hypothetical protein
MSLFDWLIRRMWKRAVEIKIQQKHGMNLAAVRASIGAARLDEILNQQFERTRGTPAAGAVNVEKALWELHRIDLEVMAMKARYEKKIAKS